jgi:hypothetical protein
MIIGASTEKSTNKKKFSQGTIVTFICSKEII